MNDTAWNKIKARIEQPDCQMGDTKYPLSGEPFFVTPEAQMKAGNLPHLTAGPSYDAEDGEIVFGERVFSIKRIENGYRVTEACDDYFWVDLPANELIAHFEAIIAWVRENEHD